MQFRANLRQFFKQIRHIFDTLKNPDGIHKLILHRKIKEALSRWEPGRFQTTLDFGCGRQPYRHDLLRISSSVIGIDITTNPHANIIISPNTPLPFADQSIELTASFQVLEHVENPAQYLAELARVCKTGGFLIISAPAVWPFHAHPNDYRRWTISGLKYELDNAGFKAIQHWPVLNPFSTSLQYALSAIHLMSMKHGLWVQKLTLLLACIINPIILLMEKIPLHDLKFDAGNHVVLAEKTSTCSE